MNYSKNPAKVRVDFFRSSGKWVATEELEFRHYDGNMLIHDAFLRSLQSQFNGHYAGLTAVCLDPYHEFAHPIMLYAWNEQHPSPIRL